MTDLILGQNGERPCNDDFSYLPMPPVSRVKDQSKLPKSLLVGGQCFNRVMTLIASVFNVSFLCKKSKIELFQKTQVLHLQHQSATCFAKTCRYQSMNDLCKRSGQ